MYQSPQHASPAPVVRRESHSSLLNPPRAQAVVGASTTGPAKLRAPGHSVPLYVRLLAIRSRLDQRPGFWFQREPSARYLRISAAFSESLGLPCPNPRTRVSSSVRLMSNSSSTWHAMNERVTDAQARTFAAYDRDDSGRTVWYVADPSLLTREDEDESPYEAGEFDWMRDLAADLLDARQTVARLMDEQAAPRKALPESACECNGDGECGYCAEEAQCRAEALGESLRDERAVRS